MLSLLQGLLHLIYPRLCEGCKKPLLQSENVICIGCEMHIPKTNYHHIPDNETALRISGRLPFLHATSLAYFSSESLLQQLIHRLKYKERKEIGIYLGNELGKAIKKENWEIDVVIPVPLHKKKQAKRGFNQSEIIAEGISEILKIPVLYKAIMRIRNTETQTDKSRKERINNVSDAFQVKISDKIKGKHILLIDDVLTTGATIESCALSLLSVPDVKISIATIGIASS